MLYNNLSGFFRKKYGKRLKKICIDGGFSCPNRDGKCGVGGCIFCGERGAGEHINPLLSIREQVEKQIKNAKEDDKFIVYFQNFSNTYADIKTLRERYDAALFDKRTVCLAVGTRPDCIDTEVAKLLCEYKEKIDVYVELGLQSSNDETAKKINRGYKTEIFEKAVNLLSEYGIKAVAHMIIGLPGESSEDALKTAKYISSFDNIWGIKIHSIYVMKGTELEKMYESGAYSPPTFDEFCSAAAECVAAIRPDMIIHRLTGDCPKNMLTAPEWNKDKNAILKGIISAMEKSNLRQGCFSSINTQRK